CLNPPLPTQIYTLSLHDALPISQDALLDDPRIRTRFKHVWIVIRFEDQAVALAKMMLDELGQVAQVGNKPELRAVATERERDRIDRKSTRLNSSHGSISYAVFCF